MGRPKQTYEERPADEDGTPFERFERALKKVMTVPKRKLDDRDREPDERARSS